MRLKTAGERLVFIDRPWFLPALFFAAGCVIGFGLWQNINEHGQWSAANSALLFGAAAMFGLAIFFSDHSRFVFDTRHNQLRWHSETFWRRRGGTLAFKDVYAIRLDCRLRDGGKRCRGVVDTVQGPLPMSRSFRGRGQEWDAIIAEIRAFVGDRLGKR
ncbi:MAG: hypothetical protein D6782_12715 [Alphaproteobacteria bacterium]|nr:MAG: hypothetical protein D6782_12715 [Alphaproteobacteria bacterium]